MSRLIDADKLIKEIEKASFGVFCVDILKGMSKTIKLINKQPTAYDVDKVVSKMETEIKENQDASLGEYRAGLYKAIEIVKEVNRCD